MNDNNFNNNNNQQFNNNNIQSSNNMTNNQPVQNQNYTYVPQQNNTIVNNNQGIQQPQIQSTNFVQQNSPQINNTNMGINKANPSSQPIIPNFSDLEQQNTNQQQAYSYSTNKEDKYYTDKVRGIIAFILLIISAVLIFYYKSLWGYLLTLITFIFTLFNRKYKDSLLKLTKYLSLFLLLYCAITLYTAYRHAKNIQKLNEQIRIEEGKNCEDKFVEEIKLYVNNLKDAPTSITIFNENDYIMDIRNCFSYDWYIIYNPYNQTYKAYVSNKYYTTEGFDETKIK